MVNKSEIFSWVGGFVVAGAIALVFVFRGEICAATWSGRSTFRCNSKLTIKGKQVTLDEHVIYAKPKCRLTLVNVQFEAPTAIYLQSGAKVTVKSSHIKGRDCAIYLDDDAELFVEKSIIEGEKYGIYVGNLGRVVMTGGSLTGGDKAIYANKYAYVTFKGTSVSGSLYARSRARVKGAVITSLKKNWSCRGKTEATLKGVQFAGRSIAVSARDECHLRIVNAHLSSRDAVALSVRGKARVIVEGGSLKGHSSAVSVRGDAVLHLKGVDVKALGDEALSLREKARVDMEGGSLKGHSSAVSVRGDAVLHLKGVDVKALRDEALSLREKARVDMEGGSLRGRYAVRAWGGAVLQLKGVNVKGQIRRSGKALIVQDGKSSDGRKLSGNFLDLAAAEAQSLHDCIERYKKVACTGVISCYREHHYSGPIRGILRVKVDADGKASRVRLRTRRAPRKVRSCIRKVAKAKRIPNFEGPEGELVCRWSGRLGGLTALSWSGHFKPSHKARR